MSHSNDEAPPRPAERSAAPRRATCDVRHATQPVFVIRKQFSQIKGFRGYLFMLHSVEESCAHRGRGLADFAAPRRASVACLPCCQDGLLAIATCANTSCRPATAPAYLSCLQRRRQQTARDSGGGEHDGYTITIV